MLNLAKAPLKQQVDLFLTEREKFHPDETPDISLQTLIRNQPKISLGEIYKAFAQYWGNMVHSQEEGEALIHPLMVAASELNRYTNTKRLFALEGLRFLASEENHGKLAYALFAGGVKQRVLFVEKLIRSVKNTDQVIQKLIDAKHLTGDENRETHKNALLDFRKELVENLMDLFEPEYAQNHIKSKKGIPAQLKAMSDLKLKDLAQGLIKAPHLNPKIIQAIAQIQTQEHLPLFAKRRHDYLKDFFVQRVAENGIPNLNLEQRGLVLACFLELNGLLKPPKFLLAQMCSLAKSTQDRCVEDLADFLSRVPPKGVERALKDFKDFLNLMESNKGKTVEEIFSMALARQQAGMPPKTIQERIIMSLMRLKMMGLLIKQDILSVLEELRNALYQGDRKQLEGELDEWLPSAEPTQPLLAKNPDLTEKTLCLLPVITSIQAFRSLKEGGNLKNHQSNRLIFLDPNTEETFTQVFQFLRRELRSSGKVIELIGAKGEEEAEFYSALVLRIPGVEPLLYCFGVTHFTIELEGLSPQVRRAPYFYLMSPSGSTQSLSTVSRKIIDPDIQPLTPKDDLFGGVIKEVDIQHLEFKALDHFQTQDLMLSLESLLTLLHLLPQAVWEEGITQEAVDFLLHRLGQKTHTSHG